MAWFISPGIPSHKVMVEEQRVGRTDGKFDVIPARVIVFVKAEYRTDDPAEIEALRNDPKCVECKPKKLIEWAKAERAKGKPKREKPQAFERPWLVDYKQKVIHNLNTIKLLCQVDDDVFTWEPEGKEKWIFKHYRYFRRKSDATRWNEGVPFCGYCKVGEE